LIPGKQFALVCLEFSPKEARDYSFGAQCVFNHNPSNIHSVSLIGHCYEPALRISNNSKVFFPPLYKGVSTKQQIFVKNESRIPQAFEWKVPDKYKSEIKFEPPRTALEPNQEVPIQVTFTALKTKDYRINIPIYTWSTYDFVTNSVGPHKPGSGKLLGDVAEVKDLEHKLKKMKKYTLEVFGKGGDGPVIIEPRRVDFGTITVGF
jgi:hypothetical protein